MGHPQTLPTLKFSLLSSVNYHPPTKTLPTKLGRQLTVKSFGDFRMMMREIIRIMRCKALSVRGCSLQSSFCVNIHAQAQHLERLQCRPPNLQPGQEESLRLWDLLITTNRTSLMAEGGVRVPSCTSYPNTLRITRYTECSLSAGRVVWKHPNVLLPPSCHYFFLFPPEQLHPSLSPKLPFRRSLHPPGLTDESLELQGPSLLCSQMMGVGWPGEQSQL